MKKNFNSLTLSHSLAFTLLQTLLPLQLNKWEFTPTNALLTFKIQQQI